MGFFENPLAVIIALVVCSAFLAAIGVFFAIKGIRTAEGQSERAFISIGKMESDFISAGKLNANRSVLYISISSEDYRATYTEPDVYREITRILLNAFSANGSASVSMCDDKTFVVLAKWDVKTARENVDNCLAALNQCLLDYGTLNVIQVKIGACLSVGTPVPFDDAINRAKQACTLAKDKKIPYAEWDISSGKALEQRIKIENNIEKEIDNNRFFLEYQPVIDAATRRIVGAEVLSRLNSETDGVITPKNFLAAVESVGIHQKFDYYIFEKNCKWISNDKSQRERYQYTVNFSRSTLSEPDFVENVLGIAFKYGLNLSCLAVEIQEDKDVLGDSRKQMMENLTQLRNSGVAVLLDDFGSGYTTFGDLQNLDISIVKIDKAITQNSVSDTGFIILKNIISTSKDIGFKTLCEGIETKEQEEAAIRAGCDLLQGYYYYRPMPVAMLEKLL